MTQPPVIVLGAGLAGWTTVREFRKLDAATLASRPTTVQAPPASGLPAGVQAAPTLVTGLEIVVERSNGERLSRVFAVKD